MLGEHEFSRKSTILYFSEKTSSFLTNEMGWIHKPIHFLDEIKENPGLAENCVMVLLVGNSIKEIETLQNLPRNSIWVLLYGDETWSPRLNRNLMHQPSLIGILRPYPVPTRSLKSIWNILPSSFSYLPNKFGFFRVVFCFFVSVVIVLRQSYIERLHRNTSKVNLGFLPGYTEIFADAFRAVYGESSASKSLLSLNLEFLENKKEIKFSFVGQVGGVWRGLALAKVKELIAFQDFKMTPRRGFGGTLGANEASRDTAMDFVETNLKSRFVISPPGNYSGSTFRWLESLICGAIPLQAFPHPYDPGFRPPIQLPKWLETGSWESIIKMAMLRDVEEVKRDNLGLRREVLNFLNTINESLILITEKIAWHSERNG